MIELHATKLIGNGRRPLHESAMRNHTGKDWTWARTRGPMKNVRGRDTKQSSMLCLISPESVVPAEHPLRAMKKMVDAMLSDLSPVFDEMYSAAGRPSIPPERLLKATLLMALYTIRSERQFCEQLAYNLLFRWFLDMDMTEPAFDASSFGKNRSRMMRHDVAGHFFGIVVAYARKQGLMSSDHFSVDGTLIEAWASMKSFRPKDDDDGDNNGWADFRGVKRTNLTHESKTDPEARLIRKGRGKEAKLSYCMSALMENRNGLLVDLDMARATGLAERASALAMLDRCSRSGRRTLAADAGYDTADFVAACRARNVTPRVAQTRDRRRRSAVDGRTISPPGYRLSIGIRRMIEKIFGWMKTTGNFRRTRCRGLAKTRLAATVVAAAYNLLRISRLSLAPG